MAQYLCKNVRGDLVMFWFDVKSYVTQYTKLKTHGPNSGISCPHQSEFFTQLNAVFACGLSRTLSRLGAGRVMFMQLLPVMSGEVQGSSACLKMADDWCSFSNFSWSRNSAELLSGTKPERSTIPVLQMEQNLSTLLALAPE